MILKPEARLMVQPGDLLLRPKASGFGFHYGTGVSGGYVAHTMPGIGKHVGTVDEFGDRKPVSILRPMRSTFQNYLVEQAALSDLGSRYDKWAANCEHDVHKAHTGIPSRTTVNNIKLLGGAALLLAVFNAFDES